MFNPRNGSPEFILLLDIHISILSTIRHQNDNLFTIFTRFVDELDLFVPTAPTPDTENTTLLSELCNNPSAEPLESNFDVFCSNATFKVGWWY